MMYAPIYIAALASPSVVTLLGDGAGGIKFWPFGEAPKDPPSPLPYATWQNVGGVPNNNVSDRPDADFYTLQINVWGATSAQVWVITAALRDAIEDKCYIVRWGNTVKDAETKAFGYDFDADWITHR